MTQVGWRQPTFCFSGVWMNQELLLKVEDFANQVAAREGVTIYDIEFVNHGRVLRVFIEKESGIGVEDCANVSRGLNLLLDVDDVIPGGAYNLEVSSPGLERSLKKPWHFQKAVGKKISLKLKRALDAFVADVKTIKSAKSLTKVFLVGATDSEITLKLNEGESVCVPIAEIEKAHVVFEFEKGKKK